MPMGKLKRYATAYDIRINRAVEKDDIIDGILAARVSYWVSLHQENVQSSLDIRSPMGACLLLTR